MFLIFVFLGVLLYVVSKRGKMQGVRRCHENPDRKHKWVIRFDNGDRRGYLMCSVCGQIPGEE